MNTRRLEKNSNISQRYVKLTGYQCANPYCCDGYDIEGHHIIPISSGGVNKYWNIIALCRKCHHEKGNHSSWREHQLKLLTWKCNFELNTFGFVFDEEDEKFEVNMRKYFGDSFKVQDRFFSEHLKNNNGDLDKDNEEFEPEFDDEYQNLYERMISAGIKKETAIDIINSSFPIPYKIF